MAEYQIYKLIRLSQIFIHKFNLVVFEIIFKNRPRDHDKRILNENYSTRVVVILTLNEKQNLIIFE